MPDLAELVDPEHTVVLTMELQRGVVGDEALLPALPEAVREVGLLDAAGRVCRGARGRGIRVVHATVRHRPDGAGQTVNCRLFALGARHRATHGFLPTDADHPGSEVCDELDRRPEDVEVPRIHGMTPFTGTELDAVVRSLGATTIVLMGVSLNLGVLGAALSAVDLGYQVVVVRDAVVGLPIDYGDAVLDRSLAMVATIATADEILAAW